MACPPMSVIETKAIFTIGANWRKWSWLRWRHEERVIVAIDAQRKLVGYTRDDDLEVRWMTAHLWGAWLAGAELVSMPTAKRQIRYEVPMQQGGMSGILKCASVLNFGTLSTYELAQAAENVFNAQRNSVLEIPSTLDVEPGASVGKCADDLGKI